MKRKNELYVLFDEGLVPTREWTENLRLVASESLENEIPLIP